MATAHMVHTEGKIPARVLRTSGQSGEGKTLCDVMAQRFMGVLVHPVPPLEMEKRVGTFHRGGKIFVYWPDCETRWYSVKPGDQLEVEGRTFTIRAIEDYPHCYGEIYIDEPR